MITIEDKIINNNNTVLIIMEIRVIEFVSDGRTYLYDFDMLWMDIFEKIEIGFVIDP